MIGTTARAGLHGSGASLPALRARHHGRLALVLLATAAMAEAAASITGSAAVAAHVPVPIAGTSVAGMPGWAVTVLSADALLAGSAGLLLGLRAARNGWRPALRPLLAAGCAVALLLALLPPGGSTDIYSYVIYGHVLVHGHSPYATTPSALLRMHDPYAAAVSLTWQHAPSVYGPLASALQGMAAWLGGRSPGLAVLWLKLAAVAAFCVAAVGLDRVAAADPRRRLRACLLWTLNPLVWWAGAAGAHVDVFGVALVAAALACWPRAQRSAAALSGTGVLLAAAVVIKAPFALAVPGFLFAATAGAPAGRPRWRRPVLLAAVITGCCAIAYALAGPAAFTVLLHRAAGPAQLGVAWRIVTPAALALIPVAAFLIVKSRLAAGARPAAIGLALSAGWLITATIQDPWYGLLAMPFLGAADPGPLDWLLPAQALTLNLALLPGLPQPDGFTIPGNTALRAVAAAAVLAVVATLMWQSRPRRPSRVAPCSHPKTGPLTTPQASRHATDRIVTPPYRAFDARLRPGPFPDRPASLLPGLLAANRTGLTPAGDDDLRTARSTTTNNVTVSPPVLLGARKARVRISASQRQHPERPPDPDGLCACVHPGPCRWPS